MIALERSFIIPILTAFFGQVIHLFGILRLIRITSIENDIFMFIIDLLVVYGLFFSKKWGFYLALFLFSQQTVMQPYWGYQSYLNDAYIIHPIECFIPSILVTTCLIILLANKKIESNSMYGTNFG